MASPRNCNRKAVIAGTNEVIRPLLSSMLTTIAVFVPLVFLSGISGAMFHDQALSVSIGLGVSFFVSITLLPTIYYHLNLKGASKWKPKPGIVSLEQSYEGGFRFIFKRRRLILLASLGLIALIPLLFKTIEKRQMPELTRVETIANISWGSNVSVDENVKRCTQLLSTVKSQLNESAFFIGQQQLLLARGMDMGESDASLYLRFNRSTTIDDINRMVETWVSNHYPDAILGFSFAESAFERIFSAPEARLVVKIAGGESELIPSIKMINELTAQLQQQFPQISLESVPQQQQLNLILNPEALALYNVSVIEIKQALEVAMQSNHVGQLAYEQQVLPIIFGDEPQLLYQMLNEITVTNSQKVEIPIRKVIAQTEQSGFRSIFGDYNSAYIPLKVNGTDTDIKQAHKYL